MQKVKNAFYEHRFGLFFFALLVIWGLVLMEPMGVIRNYSVAYSLYCVDFSFGFCTKLLPGAIYSFLVGQYDETAITIYLYAIIVLVLILISCFLEKALKNCKEENRKELFFFLCFAVACIYFFFFEAGLVYLLDFHWFMAAILFLWCLADKRLYIFIPFTMIYAIMTHYVSAICYVAVCLILLFYKMYKTQEKREKTFLTIVLVLTVVSSVGLFFYMLLFELDNVKISYPQLMSLLDSRGVKETDYYAFAFFREKVEDVFADRYNEEIKGLIVNIDENQSPIMILIQTVVQQLRINLYLADHKENFPKIGVFLPGICFMIEGLIGKIKASKLLEKLISVAGIILLIFDCIFSLLFSTDTIRWIGNSFLAFAIFFIFIAYCDKNEKGSVLSTASKIPDGVYYFYLVLCFTLPVMR